MMIAVRCQHCMRRFALFHLAPGDGCPFCGARQIVPLGDSMPAVMEPPAIERRVVTDRINQVARALVESALGPEKENTL